MLDDRKIAILGTGTMGAALAAGLVRAGMDPARLRGTVRHQENATRRSEELGIRVDQDNVDAVRGSDIIVLALKAKVLPRVVKELAAARVLEHAPLLVSVAAGVKSAFVEEAAGCDLPVVRSMPNTPCLIGRGMTVITGGAHTEPADLETARELFAPLGRVQLLDEEHMDIVTGLSGSGPAFVYVIIEALSEGGVMMGLPRDVAVELAAQTVHGASAMVLETGRHPAALKDEVTTPAGCTISALLMLEDGRLRSVLARGVQEAARAASLLDETRVRKR